MTKTNAIYKCDICGNIVEVLQEASGSLVCCGKPMTLKDERTKDGAGEKHLPVVEERADGVFVKVGEVEHPMVEAHHIQWIEVLTATEVLRLNLKAGDKPEGIFNVEYNNVVAVREYCNLHGLWSVNLK
ncbi:Desulfoferrodoxin [uncultured Clostridium sp.]|uniref:desulfoferrodoxin n=1 Tax=uncultured Clostridium sp. TaxID=59620 RepID=UPI0008205A1A|nr:desulfoferrodoxin [uncultured Clostridium sp.]SCJ71270.1 Desulfoferrodoxin [uncultured Clostridium sp.]